MREKIRNLSLSRKLTLIIMLITVVAMGVSSMAIVFFQGFALSRHLVRELKSTADVLGENSAVAFRFNVSKDAEKILSSLKAKPNIIGARFYDREKELFAEYSRDGSRPITHEKTFEEGYSFSLNQVILLKQINHDKDFIGYVCIKSDLDILYNQLKNTAITTTLILIACSFLAFILSVKLNRVISRPISSLVDTTDLVSRRNDYTLRAKKYSDDDLGKLTDGFNQMLNQIQLRDDDLQKTQNELKESISQISREKEELRKAEEQIRKLSHAIEQSSSTVVITDIKGNIEYVNPRFTQLTGYTREEVIGRNPRILKTGKTKPEEYKQLWKTITSGRDWTGELINSKKNGEHYWEHVIISPVKDDKGIITNFIAVKDDITEQKKMQEALLKSEKLKSLGTITAGISHEFNNILAIISGNVQLLEDQHNDRKVLTNAIHTIKKATEDGAQISGNMLKFTRTEKDISGFVPYKIVDLANQAIDFTMPGWKNIALSKGIHYHIDSSGLISDSYILCNPTEVREMFINIINNAMDAMIDGGTITMATRYVQSKELGVENRKEGFSETGTQSSKVKGDFVEIIFADTGIGMSEDVMKKIFDPFFTTKIPLGTGLGMSTAYGAIIRHGGTIDVESEVGKGTIFTLKFPIAVESAQQIVLPESKNEINTGMLRILVVDDEKEICNMLDHILSRDGHDVKVAYGGAEALEALKKEDFDLVLTDLLMPNVSGYDVIKALDKLDKRPKIGLITGWPEEVETSGMTVDFVIKKPFDFEKLKKHIVNIVSSKK